MFLVIVTYIGSPYYSLYQLNSVINNNNKIAFQKMIDIETVRKVHKDNFEWKTKQIVPSQQGQSNIISEMARESAQMLGNATVDTMINVDSMLALLRQAAPLRDKLSNAFFESPTRFIVRIGELGRQPIFIKMTLQDWSWRITAIYD
jgi:hypothetical protein